MLPTKERFEVQIEDGLDGSVSITEDNFIDAVQPAESNTAVNPTENTNQPEVRNNAMNKCVNVY